jgi:hypothetical protein
MVSSLPKEVIKPLIKIIPLGRIDYLNILPMHFYYWQVI